MPRGKEEDVYCSPEDWKQIHVKGKVHFVCPVHWDQWVGSDECCQYQRSAYGNRNQELKKEVVTIS